MSALKSVILTLLLLSPGFIFAQQNADAIKGEWYTEGNESVIKIFKATNGKYYGKIIWLKEPNNDNGTPKIDDKNPDTKKRKDPINGLLLLRSFSYDGDNTWSGGTIYDPQNGKTYKCTIKSDESNKLEVRGYIGISAIGRTTIWMKKK